jgi:hypothetical protein
LEDFSAGSPATMFRLYKGSKLLRNVGTYQTTRRYTQEGLYLSLRSSLPAAAAVGYYTKTVVNIAERRRVEYQLVQVSGEEERPLNKVKVKVTL